jgi:hypothetical protein
MKWYLIKLVFSIEFEMTQTENSKRPAQFDEQLRLIEEETHDLAILKARRLGKKLESAFINANNQLVSWVFVDVKEVILIDTIQDGVEVYSDTIETDDRESFIHAVLLRSLHLSAKTPVLF